jgi:hypothetical protein
MKVARIKSVATLAGIAAVGAAIALNLGPALKANNVAGGSGDSSTSGEYSSPTIPAMSVNPTAMTLGATATAAPPQATMATEDATPTLKASPAPGCEQRAVSLVSGDLAEVVAEAVFHVARLVKSAVYQQFHSVLGGRSP